MTLVLYVCCCDRLITEPEDAVPVGYELSMSGSPGWIVWAHSEHPLHVEPDAMPRNILARLLITRALQPDD